MPTPIDAADAWLSNWRNVTERLVAGAPEARFATGLAGLNQASAAFARFAEDFDRIIRPASGAAMIDPARLTSELRVLAEGLVGAALPQWPAAAGAGPEWLAALSAWSSVLAGIANDAAARFAAHLAGPSSPQTLRAAFDAWIDCAEAAFQHAAHSDAYITGQARLLNALVAERARLQQLIDQGARALGLPTRAEVDGLHDAVRALGRQLPAAPAVAARARERAARASPRAPRRARKPRK